MPRLSDLRITKGRAASFLVRLYLQEPEFLVEFHQLRLNHAESLAEVLVKQVEFFGKCREALRAEEYWEMCRAKREMQDTRSIVMKNRRPVTQGVCPVCGTKMFRIGK